MSWLLPFEPALDPPDHYCTRRCERRCEEHRHPDCVQEDLDAHIETAIAAFPAGYTPLASEVREDIETADWVRRRARPDSHNIAEGWRDAWSCYKTTAAVPDSEAFAAYVAACDNAVDTLRELVESERLHQIECDCDCSCHEV